ncbi:hypothetical protein ASD50_12875 [Mesorhizobium sp. Root552]|nr:hypothetical protein ASD50_12875 [Mesorhizobium sp. Root552]
MIGLACFPTFAADAGMPLPSEKLPVATRFYASVFAGASFDSEYRADIDPINWHYIYSLDTGWSLGGTLGARINDWSRVEAELSHQRFGIDTDEAFGNIVFGPFDFTGTGGVNATYLLANVWIDIPLNMALKPYVGGGAGVAWLEPDWTDGFSPYGHHDGGVSFAWQLGAGVQYDLGNGWAIDAGYRYKKIENADITDTMGDVLAGSLHSHNLQLGVVLNF